MTEADLKQSSRLLSLPAELIHQILTHLSAQNLATVSRTCRLLRLHSQADILWQPLVFANIDPSQYHELKSPSTVLPGSLPGSCSSWRELYASHSPRWFLTRNKLWFADTIHTGKLIVARYNASSNEIQGYALAAERRGGTFSFWDWNPEVIIHSFHPKVRLDLNQPVLKLQGRLRPIEAEAGSKQESIFGPHGMLQREVMMNTHQGDGSAGLYSMFILARPLPEDLIGRNTAMWPPWIVPSAQRARNTSVQGFSGGLHRPETLSQVCQSAFRIRKWMEFTGRPTVSMRIGDDVTTFGTLKEECYTPTKTKPWRGIWVGDYSGHGCEFLVVLQPENGEEKPLPEDAEYVLSRAEREANPSTSENRDFNVENEDVLSLLLGETEGMEAAGSSVFDAADMTWPPHDWDDNEQEANPDPTLFSLPHMVHTHHTPANNNMHNDDGESVTTENDEEGEDEEKDDEQDIYTGRIEAIKLTGDPNIPRGEYTFIAPDIGAKGLVRVADEEIFRGARVVRSVGHIAARGFREDTYTASQLILISPNRIAQYWEEFGHVSYYERVDVGALLREECAG